MTIVLYGLMLLLAAVMVYATLQAKNGAAWGKPAAGGSAMLAILLALVMGIYSLSGCGDGAVEAAAYDRAMQETTYAFEGFGKTIATDFSGSKAMLVTLETTDSEQLQSMQDALTTGLGDAVEIVHVWTPETVGPDAETPGFNAKTLDAEFKSSGADLLISLPGLPADYKDLDLLRADPPTKVALMNVRPDLQLKQLIQHNLVQLVVLPNPAYKGSETFHDSTAFFAGRYQTLRPNTLKENQGLFR